MNALEKAMNDAAAQRAEKAGAKKDVNGGNRTGAKTPATAEEKAARAAKAKATKAAKKAGVHVQDLPVTESVLTSVQPEEKTIFNDADLACEEMHRMLDVRNKAQYSKDTDIAKAHCKPYTMKTLLALGVVDREFFDMFSRHDKKLAKNAHKNFVPVKVQVKIFDACNCIAMGNITLIDKYTAALVANGYMHGGKLHKSLVHLTLQKKLEYSDDALAYAKGKMLRYRVDVAASTASTQGSSSKGENGLYKYLKLGHYDAVSGLLHLDLENEAVKKLCDIMMLASDEQVAELKGEKV